MMNSRFPFALAAAAALVLVSSLAWADPKALMRIQDAIRIAQEELDLGDAASAEMRLSEAMAIANASGMERHEATARAGLYLAAAYAAQGNKGEAVKALKATFAILPALAVPEKLKTPAFNAALLEARGGVAPEAGPQQPTGGIQHIPLDNAMGGKAVTIEANVGADVKAKQVMLFFRADKAAAFTGVRMKSVGGAIWRGMIPADATGGASLAYYIDARNAKAKVVATRGTAAKPYLVAINRPAPPPPPPVAAKPAPTTTTTTTTKKMVNAKPAAAGKTRSTSLDDENPLLEKKK